MRDIRPLPAKQGVGVFSMHQQPDLAKEYREVNVGRYWNYHFTPDNWQWPADQFDVPHHVVDAFSPNLNKMLHIGHLRQLALAASLYNILANSKFVAMFGASLGVIDGAQKALEDWFKFVGYAPQIYYDTFLDYKLLNDLYEVKEGEYAGCICWDGPKGPVVIVRSNKKRTYAAHDLVFAKIAKPTHYITGEEQKGHFDALGFADKHLVMGLVLGVDGKKIKSREGEPPTAEEALQCVVDRLRDTPEPKKVAWNVLAWNFNHCNREKAVIFDPEKWTHPDSPGMYITYTYARLWSALDQEIKPGSDVKAPEASELTELDVSLLGTSEYFWYWRQKSVESIDPAPLANYTHDLAKVITAAYGKERIIGGRKAFKFAMYFAGQTLEHCMDNLGMFPVEKV